MQRHWTMKEIKYLKKHYSKLTIKELMSKLWRTENSIKQMAIKANCQKRKNESWTEAEDSYLIQNYHKGSKACADRLSNRSIGAIRSRAYALGVTTDASLERKRQNN